MSDDEIERLKQDVARMSQEQNALQSILDETLAENIALRRDADNAMQPIKAMSDGLIERLRGDTTMSDRPEAVALMTEAADALVLCRAGVKLRDDKIASLVVDIASLRAPEPDDKGWDYYAIVINETCYDRLFVSYFDAYQALPDAVRWYIGVGEIDEKITAQVRPVLVTEALPGESWTDTKVEIKENKCDAPAELQTVPLGHGMWGEIERKVDDAS